MSPIEHKIDFSTVRDELRRRCTSPLGKEQVDAMEVEPLDSKVSDTVRIA